MNNKEEFPNRRSIRLKGYDYSQNNAYFVTICTKDRLPTIDSEKIREIIRKTWENLPSHYPTVSLDEFTIMPNHMHFIIIVNNDDDIRRGEVTSPPSVVARFWGRETRPLRKKITLGRIVAYFKYQSTKSINQLRSSSGIPFWQRNYYEHVIRNDDDLYRTRKYIRENPLNWESDEENPVNHKSRQRRGRGANGYVPGYRGAG